jgi:hypothetical protein
MKISIIIISISEKRMYQKTNNGVWHKPQRNGNIPANVESEIMSSSAIKLAYRRIS